MITTINVPDAAWSENKVPINGEFYNIVFRYNSRSERWKMDIYRGSDPIILGAKILENTPVIGSPVEGFIGEFLCTRMMDDHGRPCTRDNLGINLPYELDYFSPEEL